VGPARWRWPLSPPPVLAPRPHRDAPPGCGPKQAGRPIPGLLGFQLGYVNLGRTRARCTSASRARAALQERAEQALLALCFRDACRSQASQKMPFSGRWPSFMQLSGWFTLVRPALGLLEPEGVCQENNIHKYMQHYVFFKCLTPNYSKLNKKSIIFMSQHESL